MNKDQLDNATAPRSVDQQQACPALICDMSGCHEHATGELLVGGDEWFPLCEKHRAEEFVRTAPKWRLLPPHKPNDQAERQEERRR